jgi:hypothetical protein
MNSNVAADLELRAAQQALTSVQKALCAKLNIRYPILIDGKLCGLMRYAYTIGLLYDIGYDREGFREYVRRYCFDHLASAYLSLMTWADNPRALHAPGEWIKVKGSLGPCEIDLTPFQLLDTMHKHAKYPPDGHGPSAEILGPMLLKFQSVQSEGFPLYIPHEELSADKGHHPLLFHPKETA